MPITMQFACDFIGAQYLEYATDYRVLVEGQIRTAEAFGLDYVNTMSDPACEAADCGAGVTYFPNSPPAIATISCFGFFRTNLRLRLFPEAQPSKYPQSQ